MNVCKDEFVYIQYNVYMNFMYCIERRRKTKTNKHCLITGIAAISHSNSDSKWEWNVWNRDTAKVFCSLYWLKCNKKPRAKSWNILHVFGLRFLRCEFVSVSFCVCVLKIYVFSYHGVPSDAYSPTIKRRKEKKKREKRITWNTVWRRENTFNRFQISFEFLSFTFYSLVKSYADLMTIFYFFVFFDLKLRNLL